MRPMDNGRISISSAASEAPAFFVTNPPSGAVGGSLDTAFSPAAWEISSGHGSREDLVFRNAATCPDCGSGMVRSGACYSCPGCGYGQCG
jgi:hypothetical protein